MDKRLIVESFNPDADAALLDWQGLAPEAGMVGRWIWNVDTGEAQLDKTLRGMTGLDGPEGTIRDTHFLRRIHPEDRPSVQLAVDRSLASGEDYETRFRFRTQDGAHIWMAAQGRPFLNAEGQRCLVGVNHDVTEIYLAKERSDMIAREMAHRIKNLMSLVSSMFNMAARTAPDVGALSEAFNGRIAALARLNDLTFSSESTGVLMTDLGETVLGAAAADDRIRLDLAPIRLNGTAAQTVTLMMNELLTNASKYGALREDGGSIRISVQLAGEEFVFRWEETTAAPITPPTGSGGFGMRVLSAMSRATYDGEPEFDWRENGLHFRCTWKASEMSADQLSPGDVFGLIHKGTGTGDRPA